jgi:hypothetical protein
MSIISLGEIADGQALPQQHARLLMQRKALEQVSHRKLTIEL